jgi:hypothetical protein
MRVRFASQIVTGALGLLAFLGAATARGEVTSDQPAAIVVFPKVVSNPDEDTIIQISNATGTSVLARCFYVDGADNPASGEPVWILTDFQISLTLQQPAVWVAGEGLPAVPPDGRNRDLYPGPVPPVSDGFIGELRCVVVNDSESPISRNALTGDATLVNRTTGATRKYQAIGIPGLPGNNSDNVLLLNDVEYSSCPRLLLLNNFFVGATDPILASPVRTSVTLVPCSMDLENTVPGTATVQFEVYNEFEQPSSFSKTVTCFEDIDLDSIPIFSAAMQGTLVGHTRLRPVLDEHTDHGHGILGIAEEFRNAGKNAGGVNLHFIGGQLQADVMVLPNAF